MQHLVDGMLLLVCCAAAVAAQERDRRSVDSGGDSVTIDESGQKSAPPIRRRSRGSGESDACMDDAAVVDRLLTEYDKHKLPGGGNVSVNVEVGDYYLILNKYIELHEEMASTVAVCYRSGCRKYRRLLKLRRNLSWTFT